MSTSEDEAALASKQVRLPGSQGCVPVSKGDLTVGGISGVPSSCWKDSGGSTGRHTFVCVYVSVCVCVGERHQGTIQDEVWD